MTVSFEPVGTEVSIRQNVRADSTPDASFGVGDLTDSSLFPSLNQTGYFISDEIAAEIVAAAANNESFGIALAFYCPNTGSSRFANMGASTDLLPRMQLYTSGREPRSIVQVNPPTTTTHFATWGATALSTTDDFVIWNFSHGAGNYTVSCDAESGSLTPSLVDLFPDTNLDSTMDRFTWGAMRRNGTVELPTEDLTPIAGFVRRNGLIPGGNITNARAAWAAAGSKRERGINFLEALESGAGANVVFSHLFAQGENARTGNTPLPGGTFTYEK